MTKSTFSITEATFPQQREEKAARIRMTNIPSTGIVFKIGDVAGKADCLNRIASVVRAHDIFRTRFFFGEERLKRAVFKEEDTLRFDELSFGSAEEWIDWSSNLPDFSYLDHPLFKIYWVDVKGIPNPFAVMVCCRLLMDHAGAKALSKEIIGFDSCDKGSLPAQDSEFDTALKSYWEKERAVKLSGFWKSILASPLPAGRLPFDRLDPTNSGKNKAISIQLRSEIVQGLDDLVRQQGGSADCIFLAAFFAVLYRSSAERDICIHFHHSLPIYSPVPGNAENVLPFRRVVYGAESFLQFYRGLTTFYKNAIRNELPFGRIMEIAGMDDMDIKLYSHYGFSFREDVPSPGDRNGTMEVTNICGRTGQHDIMLNIKKRDRDLWAELEYNPFRYTEATAILLLEGIRMSIETVARSADSPMHSLNITREPFPSYVSDEQIPVHQVVERISMDHPSAVAAICNGEQLTYGELNERAGRLAGLLMATGCAVRRPVGVCLPHDLDSLVCLLAVLKAGGIYVSLPMAAAGDKLRERIRTTSPSIIITTPGFKEALADHLPDDHTPFLVTDIHTENAYSYQMAEAGMDDIAFTRSGRISDGAPAIGVTHGGLAEELYAKTGEIGLSPGCRTLQDIPMTVDRGIRQLLGTLLKGGTAVMYDNEASAGYDKYDIIESEQVEFAEFNSFAARRFIDRVRRLPRGAGRLCSLKKILFYGEGWTWHLINDYIDMLPGARLMKTVGLNELAEEITIYTIPREIDVFSRIPAGKPFSNYRMAITDEHLNLLPVGAIGELAIAGPEIKRQYQQETYRTGVLGRWTNSGDLDWIGYKTDRVSISGKHLYPGEIEFFFNSHPRIEQAVVVVKNSVITVFYKSKGRPPGREEICSFLLESTSVDFSKERMTSVDDIPLHTDGMIDYDTLIGQTIGSAEQTMLPQDDKQRRIMEIWKEAIGVGHAIDIRENFFSAGGNSLKALRVISALYEVFNIELDMKTVYDVWTIEKLAAMVNDEQSNTPQASIVMDAGERNSDGLYMASHSQARLWAVSQASAASAAYNIQQLFALDDDVDLSVFKKALAQLIETYEILRTVFVYEDQQLWQKVLDVLDMNAVFFESQDDDLRLLPQVFDLTRGPLFNIRCIKRVGSEKKYLVFTIHHIISDFWSLTILFDVLRDVYNALLKDETYRMDPPAIQYRDFASWQHKLLDARRDYYIDYWKRQLHGIPTSSGLPLDRARPAQRSYKGRSMDLELDAEVTARLNRISRDNGANLLMTMLAIFNIALYKHTTEKKKIVMIHLAGRDNEYLKRQIGLFVNTLPFVTELDPAADFNKTLSGIKKTFLEAYDSQHYPFDLLVSDLQIKWNAGQLPLSGVGFNWIYNTSGEAKGQAELGRLLPQGESGTAKFDILFTGIEREKAMNLSVEYNTDIYDPDSIKIFLEDIQSICIKLQDADSPILTLLEESPDIFTAFSF